MLGELSGRRLDEAAHQPPGEVHPLALHIGAGRLPHGERLGIVAEIDADLFQHPFGIGLDEAQALLAQHLVERDVAPDIGELGLAAAGAGGAARIGAAGGTTAAAAFAGGAVSLAGGHVRAW